ncbi:WecB/TagA/CpsF family glycosyltransferase [Candidatus Uhrbacteria bacterium]|nr:WecB/TagA/CpsF family glycosyltransferase [Candidatus Uhrbacteria bacterium]
MRVSILGAQIDAIDHDAFRRRVELFLDGQGSHTIVTPNPEFLVAAQKNQSFRDALNRADLALPDGFGLIVAARILGLPLRERVTGVDAVHTIAEVVAQRGKSMFLLGGEQGVAEKAAQALQKKYPGLKIAGAESGGQMEIGDWKLEIQDIIEQIRATSPDVLLVAFGHVKQELWMRDHLHLFPSVKIAMGVGGTLDYLAGAVSVPPRLIRSLGLEWLWRLMTQPWRAKRIFTATVHFMYLVIKDHFKTRSS